MPTALDRLLTSPSALRVLRTVVNNPELAATCLPVGNGFHSRTLRRPYSFDSNEPKAKIRRVNISKHNGSKLPHSNPSQLPTIDFESNTNNTELFLSRKLKIDNVDAQEKEKLWVEALVYRERVYGLDGVRDVFLGMRRRGYHIPTDDTVNAEFLWRTFLKYPQLVLQVLDYAAFLQQRSGRLYPRLYETCMSYWLLRHPPDALRYHHRMVVKLRFRNLPLRQLAKALSTKFTPKSLEAFMDIYRTSNERNVYDEIVPTLCDQSKFTVARRWHIMCTHRNDLPSPAIASHPVVQLFIAEFGSIPGSNANELVAQDQGTIAKRLDLSTGKFQKKSKYNEDLMRRLTGRDTAPVRFEDPFCARLFATRAFPPSSIIKGLTMVGVNEIGPQALRTMGLRADYLSELPHLFSELREAGIALKGCVFSLALEKFSMERKFHLVQSILDSDQHPEVFDDAGLQKKLLDFYLGQKDWQQAHRTLAILALFHNDASTESWNLLLQAHIRSFDPQQIIKVLHDMQAKSIMVTVDSMQAIRSLLSHRVKGHRPAQSSTHLGFDDLRFVTRIYIRILEAGIGMIPPSAWRELIRRLGMTGRFRELRRLLFWLLSWYAPREAGPFAQLPKPPQLDEATAKLRNKFTEPFRYFNLHPHISQKNSLHPVRQLFPPSLQQALIIWGFQAGLIPHAPSEQSMLSPTAAKKHFRRRFVQTGILKRLDWSVGLQTLVELRDLGVHVHPHTATKALQKQFVVLFGRGRSTKIANRIMEDVNTIPYDVYIRNINEIWGSPLFPEAEHVARYKQYGLSWHPKHQRQVTRRDWLRLSEILGSDWKNSSDRETSPKTVDEGPSDTPATTHTQMHVHDPVNTTNAQGNVESLPQFSTLGEGNCSKEKHCKFNGTDGIPLQSLKSPTYESGEKGKSGIDELELLSRAGRKR